MNFLINLLFTLLGNSNTQLYSIQYLFGVSTYSHEARKKRWEKALARVWKDKDLIDYLYYQAEADKENVFKGKIAKDLSRGARIRTLFLVYSARMAYENSTKDKTANEKVESEIKKVGKTYRDLVDIG